jgi:hypothetical protein
MIHVANLKMESLRYQELKSRIQADFVAIDAETLADTLEGITDLHEMIAAVIRSALVDEALHTGLRFRVDEMKQRLSRLEVRATKKRQLALEAMSEVGFTKLEQPDFTAGPRRISRPHRRRRGQDPQCLLDTATAQARSANAPWQA